MKRTPPLPLLAAIAALPPLSIDMYLPAIPGIAEALDTEINVIQNSLSIFLVGFSLGLLVFGPFSDRHGRRPLALLGLTGFAASSLLLSLSVSAGFFLLLRLCQGILGSAALVTVPAMIRDCYGRNTAKGMSSVSMIMLLAPLVAPLAGSFLLSLGGWELIFGALSAYGLLLLGVAAWILPETRPQAERGDRQRLFGNYRVILANPRIYLDLFCFMLAALAFFAYLTSVSFVYITYYGVSETRFGLLFAAAATALILANYINVRTVARLGARRMMHCGLAVGTVFSAALVTVSLLEMPVNWTVACFMLIVGSLGITWINADSLVLIEFPQQASSATAVTGTLRFGSGALAGPILALIYNGTPVPPAMLILLAIVTAVVLQLIHGRVFGRR